MAVWRYPPSERVSGREPAGRWQQAARRIWPRMPGRSPKPAEGRTQRYRRERLSGSRLEQPRASRVQPAVEDPLAWGAAKLLDECQLETAGLETADGLQISQSNGLGEVARDVVADAAVDAVRSGPGERWEGLVLAAATWPPSGTPSRPRPAGQVRGAGRDRSRSTRRSAAGRWRRKTRCGSAARRVAS